MKLTYLLLFIAGTLLTHFANAQIPKGSLLFGGSLNYASQKSKTAFNNSEKVKSIGIAPAFGIAIRQNLVAGADIEYHTIESDKSFGNYYSKGGGLFLRKYWVTGKRLYVFAQARAGVNWSEYTNTNSNPSDQYTFQIETFNAAATLKPGLAFSINKKIQLETTLMPLFTIQYNKTETTEANTGFYKITKKGFDVNTSLSDNSSFAIGVRILLEK